MSVIALPFKPSPDVKPLPPADGQSSVQGHRGPGKTGRKTEDQMNGREVILSSAVHDSLAVRSDGSHYTAHANNSQVYNNMARRSHRYHGLIAV